MSKCKLKFLNLLLLPFFIFPAPSVNASPQIVIIEMTPEGFTPPQVTISQNQTVTFLNKDTKPRWPASDIHPTHEIYPQFDPQKAIEPGQSWDFKPQKAGQWKFHDHLFPHFNGKLVVNEGKVVSGSKLNWVEEFKKIQGNIWNKVRLVFRINKKVQTPVKEEFIKLKPEDQFKALKDIADSKGGPAAWEYVKQTYIGQSGSLGNIHDLSHLSGGLIYDDKGFDGIRDCTTNFGFGCFHGFLDKAFAKSIDKLQDARLACLKLDTSLSGPVASCIHGIGHGVASFYSVSDLKKSLSTCRKLESGSEYCFDGVFMEFARNAPASYVKKENPLYPCDNLEKEYGYAYSSACGRNQPALLLSRLNFSFEQIIPICLSSTSLPFKQSCIDSLGFSLASSGDSEKIIQGCLAMNEAEYVKRCMQAAAGELVFQEAPNWYDKSRAVCNAFPGNLGSCMQHIDRLIKEYNRIQPNK